LEASYTDAFRAACTPEQFAKVVERVVKAAMKGSMKAAELLMKHVLPTTSKVELSEPEPIRIAGPTGRRDWALRIIEMGQRALREGNGHETTPARPTPRNVEEMLRYSEQAATEAAEEIQANTPSGSGDNEPRPSDMEENDAHENSGFDATGNGYRWRLRAGDEPN